MLTLSLRHGADEWLQYAHSFVEVVIAKLLSAIGDQASKCIMMGIVCRLRKQRHIAVEAQEGVR